MQYWVVTHPGVPPVGLFGSTQGQGTPIVVDTLTDTPYYLKAGVVTPLAGGGSGGSELPIGAIFTSVSPTNPATTLGYGTWAAFGTGRVLVGVDVGDTDFDTVEETGGSKTAAI